MPDQSEQTSLTTSGAEQAGIATKSAQAAVIIPLYNKAPWVRECLISVVRNERLVPGQLECIIVDDGSTDEGYELIRDLVEDHPWMTAVRQENQGVSAARNTAIANTSAERLLLLDADDVWLPHHARTLLEAWDQWPGATLVFSYPRFLLDGVEHPLGKNFADHPRGPVRDRFSLFGQRDMFLNTSSLGLSRRVWEAAGGFRTDMCSGEDMIMFAEAAVQGDMVFTAAASATRHLHSDNNISLIATTLSGRRTEDVWVEMMSEWDSQGLVAGPRGVKIWDDAWAAFERVMADFGVPDPFEKPVRMEDRQDGRPELAGVSG